MMTRARGTGSIERRGNSYRILYYQRGREVRESVARALGKRPDTVTPADAERLLRDRLHAIETHTAPRPGADRLTVDQVVDQYVADVELRRGKKAGLRVTRCYARIKPHVGYLRAVRLDNPVVEAWAREALGEYSEQTVDHAIAVLVSAFRLARKTKAVAAVPYLIRFKPDNARRDFFEPDEFRTVLEQLPATYADIALFAYLTGCRQREVLDLTWADVDRRARVAKLTASATKTRTARTIPLDYRDERTEAWAEGELWQLVERRWKARAVGAEIVPWVFHRDGRRVANFQHYVWHQALDAAKLPRKTFHALRRTFARDAVRAGVPESVVMARTGHKTRSIFLRYDIVSGRDLERSQAAVEAHRGAVVTPIRGGERAVPRA